MDVGAQARAVILAAGGGARLRPLAHARPKPRIRAATQPIAAFAVEALVANGLTDTTMVASYRREKLQTSFGGRQGARRAHHLRVPGSAARHRSRPHARRPAGDDVVVMGGDNVVDAQLVRDLLQAKGRRLHPQ